MVCAGLGAMSRCPGCPARTGSKKQRARRTEECEAHKWSSDFSLLACPEGRHTKGRGVGASGGCHRGAPVHWQLQQGRVTTLVCVPPMGPVKNNFTFVAADPSRLAAFLVRRILPVGSFLAPCNGRARHEYDARKFEPILDRTPCRPLVDASSSPARGVRHAGFRREQVDAAGRYNRSTAEPAQVTRSPGVTAWTRNDS